MLLLPFPGIEIKKEKRKIRIKIVFLSEQKFVGNLVSVGTTQKVQYSNQKHFVKKFQTHFIGVT
jgi:hypothetical protein